MKAILPFITLLVLLVPVSGFADDPGIMRLSLIEGDVQVLIQDTTDWTPATINLPMNEHDRLWVPENSKAELQIRRGVYIRAEGSTGLDILTMTPDSGQFYLDQGHLYINNRRGGIKIVQIDTAAASFRTYDDSIMMVDVSEDGVNEISVLNGSVYAESRAGSTTVSAGSTLTIRGERNAELSPISSPDDWEQWNIDRDQQVSAWSESSRYLPEELHEYSSDFDQNGRWDYEPEYGYVWFPSVSIEAWAPYSYGSWVWIRGNYVWIDYHPWGWAPSHYGRWAFTAHRGWCWVPPAVGGVYWSPGYVGWVVTPSYVAWVPLAPGEIYYGYGYYGPGSVNITTVNVNTVVVNRQYRNARVSNSVVVVDRDSFGTGRRVPFRVKENPFEARDQNRRNVHVVPPRTKPIRQAAIAPPEVRERNQELMRQREWKRTPGPEKRSTPPAPQRDDAEQNRVMRRMQQPPETRAYTPPRMKPATPFQQPPERMRKTRPEDVKNERPLIKQREASVFRPRQQQNLPVTRSNEPRVINRMPRVQQQPPAGGGQNGRAQQPQQPQKKQAPKKTPENRKDILGR
jgi:hypothetical protein